MLPRVLAILILLSLSPWSMACEGCSPGHDKPQAPDLRFKFPEKAVLGPYDGSKFRYAGERDTQNHYSPAVMITTGNPEDGAQCSGVMIGPRLALTAGSCVCTPRQASSGERIIDSSTCAGRAYATTVVHLKSQDGQPLGMDILAYAGAVRPHPELHVLLDARSSVTASHADLAVVELDTPVDNGLPLARLSPSEAASGEALVTAGYGHDERLEQFLGERYFRRTRVAQAVIPGGETFSYIPPTIDILGNHGGWPCLREEGGNLWLVGVTSKPSSQSTSCVSTTVYREWLRQEVQRASKQGDGLTPSSH